MAKTENCRVEWSFYKNFKILLFTIALFGNQNFSQANNNSIRIESLFQPPTITLAGQSTYKVIIHGSQENPQGSIPQIRVFLFLILLKFSDPQVLSMEFPL